jgi:hypothetical protein
MFRSFKGKSIENSVCASDARTTTLKLCPGVPLSDLGLTSLPANGSQGKRDITSGVILYSLDPRTGCIYLLLGQEFTFRKGYTGHGPWCDFGGGIEPGESVERAAAREFTEESMGCLCAFAGAREEEDRMERVEEALRNGEYSYRFQVLTTTDEERFCSAKVRHYYLKQIAWNPRLPKRFHYLRTSLLDGAAPKGHQSTNADGTTNRHYIEKNCVRYWSLERLQEVLHNGKYRQNRFRKSFLPILQKTVDILKQCYVPPRLLR